MVPGETVRMSAEDLEIKLLNEAIYHKYGYDFRNYAKASYKRRILNARIKLGCESVPDMLNKTLQEPEFFSKLLACLTVTVTEMFRDPAVYKAIRSQVVPHLRTYPEIKIWCAGCAGGEEVYSLAIMLKEEGLYDRTLIYGTDINPQAIKRAKAGILAADSIKEATRNYFESGGTSSLNEYYRANYGAAMLDSSLRDNILFSDHNLVSDGSFGEMQVVICRNVMIYFDRQLQERALDLFTQSVCPSGFLILGNRETLGFASCRDSYTEIARNERIYRKKSHDLRPRIGTWE